MNLAYNKNKLYKTLDYWSSVMLNFDFSEKGLKVVYLLHFVYDFSRKIFLMLFILTDQIYHCLIDFTLWDIGQYVYCNCLFPRL